ncbi:methyltransferase C-terminal domain-containing protein [Aeromicrobium wangtongii]|uniref:methyltransferase C-terminal domain-containing protein n=1 Tax=Aeromicrobium wangtongii TaxID=2969247 RepID=UPI0020174A7C|nr:methyltransferase C-terminal domain-containing protein [Aeromicrobium wangtongii]MCL3819891.1 methyltransferase C-terminal domain-containing protein [Aeromicrobium wangtongii]
MSGRTPCCACGAAETTPVLDLGEVPAADVFPSGGGPATDQRHPLAMVLCTACGLAQIAHDDTAPEQPLGIEPRALVEQAEAAIALAAGRGWLAGTTVREFPSPHGGTWLPMLQERGHVRATGRAAVVLDSFGIMHEADQRAAWRARAAATDPDGVLLVQFHSLAAIVRHGQWTSLRHGHAAYYSLTALTRLLADVGMSVVGVETFDLYGGTLLVAARHGDHEPDARTTEVLADETCLGVTDPVAVASLQTTVDSDVAGLRRWLQDRRDAGLRVHAYGAASVAVAQFGLAGLDRSLVASVADASPAKQGRRMPGTDIAIISPAELVAASPDLVLLTLPDLLPELEASYPELAGRWVVRGDRDSS